MEKYYVLYEITEGFMTVEMNGDNIQDVIHRIEDGQESLPCECEQDGVKYYIRHYEAIKVGKL